MNLQELFYGPYHELPAMSILNRVQRIRSRPGTPQIGALRISAAGTLAGRFDLRSLPVCYFAEEPETAIYETLARRDAVELSLSGQIAKRQLLVLQTKKVLRLLDLRPHAPSWPVLQSLRFDATQQLAEDAFQLGFNGLIYRSAQHYGHDCHVLFGQALAQVKLLQRLPLMHASGRLHRSMSAALLGSQVLLTP